MNDEIILPRHVVIVANLHRDYVAEVADEVIKYLNSKSIKNSLIKTKKNFEQLTLPPNTDLLISLGGDGTVLYCVRYIKDLGIPILPVNMGTFGYITEVGVSEWKETLESYLSAGVKHKITRRLTIKSSVIRNENRVFHGSALNELVVSCWGINKVINLGVYIDNTYVGKFRADGVIVSTPTGSTGYSLAAGGPIVDPTLASLIITPICPFALSNRPIVVSSNSKITIKILEGQRTGIMVTLDGQVNYNLIEGDGIEIVSSRSNALLLTSTNRNGFDIIRDKLNWSGESRC
ncbi:MAG: NAD(+)/NADH kinase [Spirochaetaceae bacterium]|nr:NAD(+)/NADH kinase [Spirochaetaceae bacterium]